MFHRSDRGHWHIRLCLNARQNTNIHRYPHENIQSYCMSLFEAVALKRKQTLESGIVVVLPVGFRFKVSNVYLFDTAGLCSQVRTDIGSR